MHPAYIRVKHDYAPLGINEPAGGAYNLAMAAKRRKTLDHFYLREWREFRGMSQEQAAAALHVSQATVSRQEAGAFDYKFLRDAASLYRCKIHDFFQQNPLEEDIAGSIADRVRSASAEDRKRAEAVIDALFRRPE